MDFSEHHSEESKVRIGASQTRGNLPKKTSSRPAIPDRAKSASGMAIAMFIYGMTAMPAFGETREILKTIATWSGADKRRDEDSKMPFLQKIFELSPPDKKQLPKKEQAGIVADTLKAAELISNALNSSGYKADFSIESLHEIDRFFDEQAPNGKIKPDGLLGEDLGSRLFALGAYFGETLRKKAGGQWRGDDSDPRSEINIELTLEDGTTLWPVQRVMKRFKNGQGDALFPYARALVEKP